MFDNNWSSAIGDIEPLICRVTSKNHMTEVPFSVFSGYSSFNIITLPSLVAIYIVVVEM